MPAYMMPAEIDWVAGPLPRNANGKTDRALLVRNWLERQVDKTLPSTSGR